jgi:prephenate dehydrogenase
VRQHVTQSSPVTPIIGRLTVIGLGLIGGSFAKGLRESGLCQEVVGCDPDPLTQRQAVALGVVDSMAADLPSAVLT